MSAWLLPEPMTSPVIRFPPCTSCDHTSQSPTFSICQKKTSLLLLLLSSFFLIHVKKRSLPTEKSWRSAAVSRQERFFRALCLIDMFSQNRQIWLRTAFSHTTARLCIRAPTVNLSFLLLILHLPNSAHTLYFSSFCTSVTATSQRGPAVNGFTGDEILRRFKREASTPKDESWGLIQSFVAASFSLFLFTFLPPSWYCMQPHTFGLHFFFSPHKQHIETQI